MRYKPNRISDLNHATVYQNSECIVCGLVVNYLWIWGLWRISLAYFIGWWFSFPLHFWSACLDNCLYTHV